MGACQSRADGDVALNFPYKSYRTSNPSSKTKGTLRTKLRIIPSRDNHVGTLPSPSEKTDATAPTTPSSTLSSPQNQAASFAGSTPSASTENQQLESLHEESEEYIEPVIDYNASSSLEASLTLGCQLGGAVIDSVIAEEESIGAPSDEEDAHQELQSKKISKSQTAVDESGRVPENELHSSRSKGGERLGFFPRPNEKPALSQSGVKLLSKRITTPESIIHRPPLLAPPQGAGVDQLCVVTKSSVNPQTIAHFNRLKIQVQLANRAEKQRKHKEKVQDRFEDVKGYRSLWTDYEVIKGQVKEQTETSKEAPPESPQECLSLTESKSWYFDFQALKTGELDDDDNQSLTSMSLLTDANMEIQRKLFKEKRKSRKERKSKKTKLEKRDTSDERSVGSINSSASRKSVVFIRGQPAEADYGPIRQVTVPGMVCVDSDDDTPKASSRAGTDEFSMAGPCYDDSSVVSDLDMDNDYNVPRRRRRHHDPTNAQDDQSVSTLGERSLEEVGLSQAELGTMTDLILCTREFSAPKSVEVKTKTPKSPDRVEKYGFDPSAPLSSQMDLLTMPSVQIDSADTGVVRWRKFCTGDEGNLKFGGAARRLEDLYGANEDEAHQRDAAKLPDRIAHHQARTEERETESAAQCHVDGVVPETQQDDGRKPPSEASRDLEEGRMQDQASQLGDKSGIAECKVACTGTNLSSGACKLAQSNPYEGLTPDQFLMLSWLPCHDDELDEQEDRIDSQDEARRPHDDRDSANESEKKSVSVAGTPLRTDASVKIAHSAVQVPYKPAIDDLPSETFLLLSAGKGSNDGIGPDHDEADASQSLAKAQSLVILGGEGHAYGKGYVSDILSVEPSVKPPVATEIRTEKSAGSPASVKLHACQTEAFLNSMSDADSATKPSLSIDECDLLSNNVSAQIDKLLSEFRQDPQIELNWI